MSRLQCFIFLKKGTFKSGKSQILKMDESRYIAILIKSKKGLKLVFSLQHWAKNMLEMFAIQQTSVRPNFILMIYT